MRKMSNCLLVAALLWLSSRCREYAIMRRSRAFFGLIPHFLYGARSGWRYVRVIEYIPPKNMRWRSDYVILYPGTYRVLHLRVQAIRRWATKEQALADYYHDCAKNVRYNASSRLF